MSRYRRECSLGASWFFTVALAYRGKSTLVEHIDRLRTGYAHVARTHPFITEAICVLPDHLHALWTLPPDDADYPRRWSLIRAYLSRSLPADPQRSASKAGRREKGIWQRRYWEHRIRDEQDWIRHVDYIHYNPVKHGLVGRVQEWPHSSFHRHVRQGWIDAGWGGDHRPEDIVRGEP